MEKLKDYLLKRQERINEAIIDNKKRSLGLDMRTPLVTEKSRITDAYLRGKLAIIKDILKILDDNSDGVQL